MSAPSRDHGQTVRHRARRVEALPAIGKGIGGHIDDAHDERALAQRERRATRQRHAIVLARTHINDEGHENLVAFELTIVTVDCRLKTVD